MPTSTETFGPVTAVVRYDDVDEAVRMANDTVHGLMAYVFGEEREAMAVARRLEAGMVAVNRGVVSDPAAPLGLGAACHARKLGWMSVDDRRALPHGRGDSSSDWVRLRKRFLSSERSSATRARESRRFGVRQPGLDRGRPSRVCVPGCESNDATASVDGIWFTDDVTALSGGLRAS
jgi:hypothetical protein